MHISDALISAPVGIVMWGTTIATASYAIKKIDLSENSDKLPLIGVMGAFTFAAQMINFAIPGTGASGHLTGGLFLATLLGPHLAFLTMMSLLLIQALFFGDGGLIAYGANVFNMGVLTCYVMYPLIYLPLQKRFPKSSTLIAASIGAMLSAFAVVLELTASRLIAIPILWFLALMLGIHFVIGLIEGGITKAILAYLQKHMGTEAKRLTRAAEEAFKPSKLYKRILVLAVIIAGGLSYFTSANPDGLEWSLENALSDASSLDGISKLQSSLSIFNDYSTYFTSGWMGTAIAGIAGVMLTFGLLTLFKKGLQQIKIKQESLNGKS